MKFLQFTKNNKTIYDEVHVKLISLTLFYCHIYAN